MADFTKYNDTIDSRDIIERMEEIESELKEIDELSDEDKTELDNVVDDAYRADLADELEILTQVIDDIGFEATYGVTLINEDYFEDYAREFAEDIGAINRDMSWPANCIDWEQATKELKMDYSELDFDGQTFLFF